MMHFICRFAYLLTQNCAIRRFKMCKRYVLQPQNVCTAHKYQYFSPKCYAVKLNVHDIKHLKLLTVVKVRLYGGCAVNEINDYDRDKKTWSECNSTSLKSRWKKEADDAYAKREFKATHIFTAPTKLSKKKESLTTMQFMI